MQQFSCLSETLTGNTQAQEIFHLPELFKWILGKEKAEEPLILIDQLI